MGGWRSRCSCILWLPVRLSPARTPAAAAGGLSTPKGNYTAGGDTLVRVDPQLGRRGAVPGPKVRTAGEGVPERNLNVSRNQGAVMPSVWWLPRPAACWAHRLSVLGRQNAHRGELATLGPHRPRSASCPSLCHLAGARSSARTWEHGLEYASDHASQPRVPRGKGDRAADLFPDCGVALLRAHDREGQNKTGVATRLRPLPFRHTRNVRSINVSRTVRRIVIPLGVRRRLTRVSGNLFCGSVLFD